MGNDRMNGRNGGQTAQADRLETAAEELLGRLSGAGAPVRRVVWTTNRRVMISLAGKDRATLRLHQNFAAAPDEVVVALATWLRAPRHGQAARALRTIRAFLQHHPPPARQRVRRVRRMHPADAPYLERLRAEFERVNAGFFDGTLPEVPLQLCGRMRRRNGHFCAHPLEIVISRRLCVDGAHGEAEHTLRHEMIHLWQHASGLKPGHGPDFRRWARRLDVHPRARRNVRWKEGVADAI